MSDEPQLENVQLVPLSIFDIIKTYIGTKNARVNLDNKAIDIISRVLDLFPELFDKINESVKNIMEDGVFDVNDIPTLVLMIKDVINIDRKELKNLKITRTEAILMLEGVIVILIDEDVIKTGVQKESMKNLLRLSIRILESNVDLSETINCNWLCC